MTAQQRNTVITLVTFMLILAFFCLRVLRMVQTETFTEPNVFRLWGIVIGAVIVVTILATILGYIFSAIIHTARTNEPPGDHEYLEDERDKLIDLKSIRISNAVYTIGVLIAMITFVLKQPPLVMFTLLIASGLVAQIIRDIYRLYRYSQGA